MVETPYAPYLFGVQHTNTEARIAKDKKIIDKCAEKGLKTIGLERFFTIRNGINAYLKSKNGNLQFKEFLKQYIFPPTPNYFLELEKYAKSRGLTVLPLEGQISGDQIAHKVIDALGKRFTPTLEEQIQKRGLVPVFNEEFNRRTSLRLGIANPETYLTGVLRDQQMIRRANRLRPDALIVGTFHAWKLRRALRIPRSHVWIAPFRTWHEQARARIRHGIRKVGVKGYRKISKLASRMRRA